jgi:hypothetical protein
MALRKAKMKALKRKDPSKWTRGIKSANKKVTKRK